MFSKLVVFSEKFVMLVFSKLLGLMACEGLGLSCRRRSPQGLCSLTEGFRINEEGVLVLGVIQAG